ncbi:shikimate dehydrogenase [Pontibacillus litoralis]|uniref:Shikimate dehydrogenase (NADP(+)) n=1 Tax=Pontibacillus litoralis JSM 072002 TaxID=1385512 RepID=A0A0A5GCT7_9BACI|nr:shikimate dehydrogenase [Pontibacillus litoralis]KGX88945.1 shikimate 5-dehydrogenase [Pontibacillus litoralis JSM 072002]
MRYLFGLIGYPALHSQSPWIHHQFLKQQNKQGLYRVWETAPNELENTLNAMKTLQVDGFNVTVPYKEKMLEYVDRVDPYAAKVGAINTVLFQNGEWIGYNTDGKGFVRSLQESYPDVNLEGLKVLIVGAGGAARGIYTAFLEKGVQRVDIANRTTSRADSLLTINDYGISSTATSLQQAEEALSQYDVIVQTTSVGMSPKDAQQIMKLTNVKQGAIVADIVYKPLETSFLQDAKHCGGRPLHGDGMLVYQAALSYEIWTDTTIQADKVLQNFKQKQKGDSIC